MIWSLQFHSKQMSADDSKLQNQFDTIAHDQHYILELQVETSTFLPKYVLDIYKENMLDISPLDGC